MKVNWVAAMALAVAASTGLPLAAHAQTGVYTVSDIAAEPAASTTFEVPAVPAASIETRANLLGPGEACGEEAAEGEACPPWRLFPQCEGGWNLTGFLDAGITGNGRFPADRFNGVQTFNDRNEAQLNELWLTLEKTIDTKDCGWSWGGRFETMWGSDYVFHQNSGLELHDDGTAHWNGAGNLYGIVVPQAYVEAGNAQNSLKLGRFYTPVGYEGNPSTGNFFYSHCYTHQYGEPFYHTGLLYKRTASENLSWLAGLINGWDSFDREMDRIGGLFGATWTNDNGLSVAWSGVFTNDPRTGGLVGYSNRYLSSLVISKTFRENWTYVFQNDAGWQEDNNVFNQGVGGAEWYGLNQYLFYKINDCWRAGGRFEWFRDDDGARVGAVRPGNQNAPFGLAGNFYEISGGLNWTPTSNLIVRPEVRYDWFDGQSLTGLLPFNAGTDTYQFTFAVDAIVLF